MNKHISFLSCDGDDVLSFQENQLIKIDRLKRLLNSLLEPTSIGRQISNTLKIFSDIEFRDSQGNVDYYYEKWFKEGIKCEILKLGADKWQQGRIKINLQVSIEFCPEQSESSTSISPLDDIRQIVLEDC